MDAQERERKLRLVKSAAGSAVGNGCTPDEVRTAVEAGIAEALELDARLAASRASTPLRPAAESAIEERPSALTEWARAVDAA